MSEKVLAHAFVGMAHLDKIVVVRGFDSESSGRTAWRLAGRLGAGAAADFLEAVFCEITDEKMWMLGMVAWLRGDLPRLLESGGAASHLNSLAERSQVHADPAVRAMSSLLQHLEALEDAVQTLATTTSPGLIAAVQAAHNCIPLWIASGRNVPALRRALEARADQLDLSPAFEHALAAEDTARAFTRLGAESRAFARVLLRELELDDLLARLPPEPDTDLT